MNFLKLTRLPNLLLIALMQLILYFELIKKQNLPLDFSNFNFYLLLFATIFIAAAGYIINDIFDQDTDTINKPNNLIVGKFISETSAYNFYIIINIIGVALGFYLSNRIDKPGFATIFIFIAALLYFYTTNLKSIPIVGNLSIAFISSLSILIVPVFILFPFVNEYNSSSIRLIFSIINDYAIFAFMIHFIREIIKDCEDYEGDNQTGVFTIAVKIGIAKTKIIVLIFLVLLFWLLIFYINNYLIINKLYYATWFILLFILGPLLYIFIELFKAKETLDFKKFSFVLKIVMFFSILSLLVIQYNIKINVT